MPRVNGHHWCWAPCPSHPMALSPHCPVRDCWGPPVLNELTLSCLSFYDCPGAWFILLPPLMSQRGPLGAFPSLSFLHFFTLSTSLMNMPPKSSLDVMSVLFLVLPLGETVSCAGREMNPMRATNKYQTPPVPSILSFPFSHLNRNKGRSMGPPNFSSHCSFIQDCLPSWPLDLKPVVWTSCSLSLPWLLL